MKKLQLEELNRLSLEEFAEARKTPLVVVLDNIRSLSNVGSVFRTCDAFAVEALYLCGLTGTPPNREIQKTALGATESVAWKHYTHTSDALAELKEQGYRVLAVEQTSQSQLLHQSPFDATQKYVLVFGNEVEGVSEEALKHCEQALEIPQSGTKHSLNIAVSAGMVLWEAYKELNLKKL